MKKMIQKTTAAGKGSKAADYSKLPKGLRVLIADEARSNPLHTGNENSVIVQALDEYFVARKKPAPAACCCPGDFGPYAAASDLVAGVRMIERTAGDLDGRLLGKRDEDIEALLCKAMKLTAELETIGLMIEKKVNARKFTAAGK